jgi:hypothetical protein
MNKLQQVLQEIKGTDLEISAGKTFTYPSGGIGGNWAGSADMLKKLVTKASKKVDANELNTSFSVNSKKREKRETASGKISDHYRCATASAAYDLATSGEPGWRCWDAILDAMVELGWSTTEYLEKYREPEPGSYLNVRVGDYRIQPIWQMDSGHKDHVHVGIRNTTYPDENNKDCDPKAASGKNNTTQFKPLIAKGTAIVQAVIGVMDQLDPDVNRIPTVEDYDYEGIINNIFKNYANTIWPDDNEGAAKMLEKHKNNLAAEFKKVLIDFEKFLGTVDNNEKKNAYTTIFDYLVATNYEEAKYALENIIESIRNGDTDSVTFGIYYWKRGTVLEKNINTYTYTAPRISKWRAKLSSIFD